VLLGELGALRSPVPYRGPLTYLHVRLRDGETWRYAPPPGHDVAWLAVARGGVRVAGAELQREMAVFEEGDAPVEVVAAGDAEFVLGSAAKHPHDLVCGYYSVHTSAETLRRGEAGIVRVGQTMKLKKSA